MGEGYQKTTLQCPCGEIIQAETEEALVVLANAHLEEKHPDLAGEYTREQILFLAY
jgi:hypothetical protein